MQIPYGTLTDGKTLINLTCFAIEYGIARHLYTQPLHTHRRIKDFSTIILDLFLILLDRVFSNIGRHYLP